MWIIGGLVVLVFASMAWPLIDNAQRPKQLTFKVQAVYSQPATIKDAFSISGMTRNSVVAEGPCNGDCTGGILSHDRTEIKTCSKSLGAYRFTHQSNAW